MKGNLEYYRIFYEVAKAGSITAAASKLCISQPAVSQQIKQLEEGFGSPLFVRGKKGVRLTAEGEVFFGFVERGFAQFRAGETAFQRMVQLDSGQIHIGASDMTLQFYLLPYLERFHEQFPGVKVQVTNGPTPETLRYLRDSQIDFGVVSSFDGMEKEELVMTPVREIRDCFVAGTRFFDFKDKPLNFRDLCTLPIVCLERDTSTRASVDRFLELHRVQLHPEFELATSDIIVQFARRNLGIGLVVYDFAKEYVESGELICLSLEEQLPARQICIATRNEQNMSKAAKELLSMMQKDNFSRDLH